MTNEFSVSPEHASVIDAYRLMQEQRKTSKMKAKEKSKENLSAEDDEGKSHKRAYGKNQSHAQSDTEH